MYHNLTTTRTIQLHQKEAQLVPQFQLSTTYREMTACPDQEVLAMGGAHASRSSVVTLAGTSYGSDPGAVREQNASFFVLLATSIDRISIAQAK